MKGIQSALINLPNVNINGSPTITSDFVASGFSADNYLTIPYDYVDINVGDTLELVVCVITGNDITGDQPFAQAAPYVDMSVYNGDLSFWNFGSSTHNTITTASPNTKYWVKEIISRLGTTTKTKVYSYSTDGINYTTVGTLVENSTESVSLFTLGVTNWFGAFFTGTIDLSECYIKVNNNIVWRGVKQGRKIKAVVKTETTNYYGWIYNNTYKLWITTNNPNEIIGAVVYSSPNPSGATPSVVENYYNGQIIVDGFAWDRHSSSDTTYTGTNYKLINQQKARCKMFKKFKNWIKKKVLKSIIKDITKEMPKYKDLALIFIEQRSGELLDKVHEAIKKLIEAELAKALNK